jgi:signal transduction histidine kinase
MVGQANMQAGLNAATVLAETLHAITTGDFNSSPRDAALYVLDQVREALGAAGVCFVQAKPDEPPLVLVVGDAALWTDDASLLASWLPSLPPDLAHNLPAPFQPAAPSWYTFKTTDTAAVCLWAAHVLDADDAALLPAFADVLQLAFQREQARRQQLRANLLAQSIVNSIADPLLVLDENLAVTIMNPAAEQTFAISSAEAHMKPLDTVVNDELMALIRASNDSPRLLEWSTGENDEYTFLPRLAVVHTPNGLPDGWVLALRDVSRFKRLNRNQQEFMRVVSHDLRSPLASMQGFADMIRMGMVGEVTDKQAYFLDKILAGITQMTGIVDNIQDAGRFDPETGFYDMQRDQVDLGEIARQIVKNHIIPAEKQELTLEISISDDVPIINGDENMLTRALTNLVDNAIKYTPNGGTVRVGVQMDGGHVAISVSDDGYGINEEDQRKLFQRHVRIRRKEHAKVKGTGLGLFIVRSVAQRHGGDAHVYSVPGEGTTFSLVIPVVPAEG